MKVENREFLVQPEAIEAHYEVLNKIGNLGPSLADGFTRVAYSPEETLAMKHFETEARGLHESLVQMFGARLSCSSRWDQAGNLVIEITGEGTEYVEMGSHLDTVPNGGNFDGVAGVVAGFQAIKTVALSGESLKRGLRLRIWRGEESAAYGVVYCGSRAAFGLLAKEQLEKRFQGQTLAEAMERAGAKLDFIRALQPTISQAEIDSIYAHLELHIEQGNLLEVSTQDVGIVTSIRGPERIRVVLRGEFDHSGATPLGRNYRKDVNLALGYILVRINELAETHLKAGADLVQTVGLINSEEELNALTPEVYQNGLTKVSGYGYFTLDIRSADNAFRQAYCKEIRKLITETAAEFVVSAEIEELLSSAAVEALDQGLIELSAEAAEELSLSYRRMPSGAGHDCANVAKQRKSDGSLVAVGMLFIPCKGGKSHSPQEFASSQAIARGASVLARVVKSICCG